MLRGINDSKECANQLTKIMAQFPCKVNLIEFNPWPGVNYLPTERERIWKVFLKLFKMRVTFQQLEDREDKIFWAPVVS